MQVILLKDVNGTGKAGEAVKVSDGYARNMLIPKGMAKEATDGNIRTLEKAKEKMAEKAAADKAAAQKTAEDLKGKTVVIKTKGGDSGRLFGSITSMDIAEAATKQLGMTIDKKKIVLDAPIKQVGTYIVPVKLYTDVTGEISVQVEI